MNAETGIGVLIGLIMAVGIWLGATTIASYEHTAQSDMTMICTQWGHMPTLSAKEFTCTFKEPSK